MAATKTAGARKTEGALNFCTDRAYAGEKHTLGAAAAHAHLAAEAEGAGGGERAV